MKEYSRTRRLGEQLQRELAQLIAHEIELPVRGVLLTLSAVDVAPDLSVARVLVTMIPDEVATVTATVRYLNHAAGFLRGQIGRLLHIKRIPRLEFIYDESVERGSRLSHLIDQALRQPVDERDQPVHQEMS